MELNINGKNIQVDVEETMPLLWVLRDELHLTGTKYGCGVSACGACSVMLDGVVTRTCILPVSAVVGKAITTIEGIAKGEGQLSAVQKAWIENQVPHCGYCQSRMIMAAVGLLNDNPDPTDEDIDAAITNICRCGTYQRVRSAIKSAAKLRAEDNSLLSSL